MSIRSTILAGCLALTALTGLMGLHSNLAEQELGRLALRIYDEAFMGVSYLRSAQVGFAVAERAGKADPALAEAVLGDLQVARERAMSDAGRGQAEALRLRAETVLNPDAKEWNEAEAAAVGADFEGAVETFAADGYRYRRNVKGLVDAWLQRSWLTIVVLVLAALTITAVITRVIAAPVRSAVRIAQSIAAGTLDNVIKPWGRGETADLLRALATMQDSIAAALARIRGLMADQAVAHAGELAAQHAKLEAALANMNQGLCLFGPDGHLAVVNRRFTEMFGAPVLGLPPREALGGRGLDAVLDGTADGADAAFSCDLPDGRTIAVSQRPVTGGGWVTTYEDASERRAAEARLSHMARHDLLTGLPNRLLFGEHVSQALARVRRPGGLAVLCLGLDRFKSVNDTLGHAVGDALLQEVGRRLAGCIQDAGLVVRLGGDEFAIVQEIAADVRDAERLAQQAVQSLAAPFAIDGQHVAISASLGIAVSGADPASADELLKHADMAMHRAKTEGRGTYRFFETEMDTQLRLRRALELDLRSALQERQFELYFQPLVTGGSGTVIGFEALIRWNHPKRGLVSPALFIGMAEELGLIGAIGAWVLEEACRTAAGWPGASKVAVNLSPAQFRDALADEVAAALAASGLAANRLELEITESVLMKDGQALDTLRALRSLGVRIAMDDFGTGYSSLNYLQRFPFDKIKIDQSFVRGMTDRADCLAIVRAVIGLGRALGMAVSAEGVETPAQLEALRAEGCGELQGYLFSKPRPGGEVGHMLQACPSRHREALLQVV